MNDTAVRVDMREFWVFDKSKTKITKKNNKLVKLEPRKLTGINGEATYFLGSVG